MTLLIFTGLSIGLSIVSEWASELIYYAKIRRSLIESCDKKPPFDWLPHKRKSLVLDYIKHVNGNDTIAFWGRIVIWLEYISWAFLIIAGLSTLLMI